jgi:hypothetical protein
MVEVPQTLYHYTSMEGLLGIVQKRQIWASHIRYLNDRMEQDHIWSVVENRARERLKQTDDPAIKSALETLPADVARRTRTHAYVASFSADGDLLSQWLSYCPDGKGFAIGFGTRSLSTNNLAQHKKMIEMHAAGVAPDPARLAALYSVSYYSGTSAHSQYDPLFLDALIDVYCVFLLNPISIPG